MKSQPDWTKYGLQDKRQTEEFHEKYKEDDEQENELFTSDPDNTRKPWWQANFLVTERVYFGTWDGVFTSCMLNIFGIVIFLRTGWIVGIAGLGLAFLIIIMTMIVALLAVSSAVGICERCQVESGGVYFLLTHVLGARFGTSVGFLYCFGQAVASSLYVSGFSESIISLLGWSNEWIAKGIGIGILILLLGINLAGIKWVIRLQLVLLLVLFVSVLDFSVGSFLKQTPTAGVIGYSVETFRNNSYPQFSKEYRFFTVFGVFFPTATGVCAGINMSGDLYRPKESIPHGTFAALGVSFILYSCFAIILGGSCLRETLVSDHMITAKVAFVGPLLLFGLYVSSLSAALGGVTIAPKILVKMADSTKLPGTSCLAKTWGKNKVAVVSIVVVVIVAVVFVLIGNINILGPIVTMPFLFTYGSLTYAYFALAMSFEIQQKRDSLFKSACNRKSSKMTQNNGGVEMLNGSTNKETDFNISKVQNGVLDEEDQDSSANELDTLFPERQTYGSIKTNVRNTNEQKQKSIIKQPRSYYSLLTNRWLSLVGTICFILLMFAVDWLYALAVVGIWILIYFYIGYMNPGLFPGVSKFQMTKWLYSILISNCMKETCDNNEIMVPPKTPQIDTEQACITEMSDDYINRGKYHQAQLIRKDKVMDAFTGAR